jgi:hypothetical protein
MNELPPSMFSRPTDAPEPLPPIRSGAYVSALHSEWARRHGQWADSGPTWRRMARRARSRLQRSLGGADTQLLGDLVRAVDALAARCDEMTARLSNQEAVVAELAQTLGREVTRLRATVDLLTTRSTRGEAGTSSGD